MINYVKGDVLESGAGVVAHGCNCKGGFGSGVAGAVTQKYPYVRANYIDKFMHDGWTLGEVQLVEIEDNRYIANCATQNNYLPRGVCHADYVAIKTCMEKVKNFAIENNLTVAIPKIGAGLAGGDWNKIEGILNEVFVDHDVSIYTLE